jgi:Mg-chelatase subunit ChlD
MWRGRGPYTGTDIIVSGIPTGATVECSFLYWCTWEEKRPPVDSIKINGNPINEELIGIATEADPHWLPTPWNHTYRGYRADVSAFVTDNGIYAIEGFPTGYLYDEQKTMGASIVTVYSLSTAPYVTIVIKDGMAVLHERPQSYTVNFSSFVASSDPIAHLTQIAGQSEPDWELDWEYFNGNLLAQNEMNASDGDLWDTDTYNVSSYVSAGDTHANSTISMENDWIGWVASVFLVTQKTPGIPPVADAGPDQTVNECDVVHFDGTGSYDPDGIGIGSWEIQTVNSTYDVGRDTSIALDSQGYPHISHCQYPRPEHRLKYAKWTGSSWQNETVYVAGYVSWEADMALDSKDNPHIAYRGEGIRSVEYVYHDGNNWIKEIVDVTPSPNTYWLIAMSIDNEDNPHVSYHDYGDGDLRYAKRVSGSWNVEIVDSTGRVGDKSSIAVDSNNYPHITYIDETNEDLKYAYYDGTRWILNKVDSIGGDPTWSSIVLDDSNHPHIAYYHYLGNQYGQLRYARWDGSTWNFETIESIGSLNCQMSIELDSKHNPHISYRFNQGQHCLKYAKRIGNSWSIETVDMDYMNGKWNSLALDYNDFPHISYEDYANKDLKYARWTVDTHLSLNYSWDFNTFVDTDKDGDPANDADAYGSTPTYTYNDAGIYNVILKVTDSDGDTDTDTCDITVLQLAQPPVANAGPDQTVNEGDIVQFNGSGSYIPNDTLDTYEWDFDLDFDSDNDGDPTNDVDATGSTPTHIYGDDGVYNVSLTVKARIETGNVTKVDQDVVFVMDSSGSMNWNDPMNLRIEAAKNYVDTLTPDDRGAVVEFDTDASLIPDGWPSGDHFSSDYTKIKQNLDLIDSMGGTGISTGLNLSNEEHRNYGQPSNHVPIIILLTDAQNNDPEDNGHCINEAIIAASRGIRIFTIGLTMRPFSVEEQLLTEIARITGGKYYPAPDASNLNEIYEEISEIVENRSYEELSDTDTMLVTVKNVVPTLDTITVQDMPERLAGLTEEWVARYNGPGNRGDAGEAIAVDSFGNIIVTGESWDNNSMHDYCTIKYDSSGNELWVARYNGPGNDDDRAYAIATDLLGNSYVTGFSRGISSNKDYCTIKYDSSGNELWVVRYNGPGNDVDKAQDIAIDSSGNVYVTGGSMGSGADNTFATVAYDSMGNELWVARYIGPDITGAAIALIVDLLGNIYVTGNSKGIGTGYDYVTIKYDSSGNELWVARYSGPGNNYDNVRAIIVDESSGNVYVTGASYDSATDLDYATVAYDSFGNEHWVARYNGLGTEEKYDYGKALALDSSGYIYVTGASRGTGTSYDYATIKYDMFGNELWVKRYNGPGNDWDDPYAMAIDSSGNIFITGESYVIGNSYDYATIAYDSSGNALCDARYNGPESSGDRAIDMKVDSLGNVYVTGYSIGLGSSRDYCTIKYSPLTYYECCEGSSVTFTTNGSDTGSDDLIFTWQWGDGTPDTITTYYNDNIGPEPVYDPVTNGIKTPWGEYPFNVTDTVSHTYGDDGVYTITLTVEDDDGGIATYTMNITVRNVNPTIEEFGPFTVNEGSQLPVSGTATDLGSDDLTFTWQWGDGTSTVINTHYNDGINPEPDYDPSTNEVKSPLGTYPFSVTDSVSHIYGDDGVYTITLTVEDDDDGSSSYETEVTVNNVAPAIALIIIPSGDEGSALTFEAEVTDPGSDDLTFTWDFECGPTIENLYCNDGVNPELVYNPITNEVKSPLGTFPFNAYDVVTHTYGDDYNYALTLTVTDDDGGTTIYTTTISVNNIAPSIYEIVIPSSIDEGAPATFQASTIDKGSDDLTFTWEFEYGPTITNVHYNDGVNPDPYPSPWSNCPFNVTEIVSYTYGDNGIYTVTLTVTDDDGGMTTYTTNITVNNVAPTITPFWPTIILEEGTPFTLSAASQDQGSDDLTFTWDFEHGPTITNTYYNDGSGPDPYPSPGGNYPFSATDLVSHTYGDNGVFLVTLTVEDDDGGSTTYVTNITVNNVNPIIEIVEAYMHVNFTLRVAGEKWHSVNITLYEDDSEIWSAGVTRHPGSPDEQAVTLSGYSINFGCTYRAVVDYIPNDPRVNGNVWGGNPVWIILEFQDGTSERLHHTFNVRQSDWNSDHWNHIDPWEVDLTGIIYRHNITFEAIASDPGSDDLIFHWDFGDGGIAVVNTYFNNGVSPDPDPSPEVNPMNVIDTATYAYGASGNYTVTLTVTDDDGGITTTTLVIMLQY